MGSASATGDPNDDEPGADQGKITEVKRRLRPDDLGISPQNVAELRGQVSLEGKTLTVRVDMIRGVGPPGEENLGASGITMIRSLQALARENGASTLRIQGSLANDDLEAALLRRYGGQIVSQGGVETITFAVN